MGVSKKKKKGKKRKLTTAINGLIDATVYQMPDGSPVPPEALESQRRDSNPNPKETIEYYLASMESIRRGMNAPDEYLTRDRKHDPEQLAEARADYTRVWSRMRQARIFDVPALAWVTLYHVADRWVDEVIGESSGWKPANWDGTPSDMKSIEPEVVDRMNAYYFSNDSQLEWPDHLPFETTYIGFGNGAGISRLGMQMRKFPAHSHGTLLGYVINEADKSIDEVILLRDPDGSKATSIAAIGWQGKYNPLSVMTLSPLVVHTLIEFINEHKTIVVEKRPSSNDRYAYNKSAKRQRTKLLPRPYYIVPVRAKLIKERARSTLGRIGSRPRLCGHRYDVRGHERIRIERGTLPIKPKDEKKLLKRGYRIYTNRDRIQNDDFARMLERKVPLIRTGEWVAILVTWVDSFVKGPLDAPYIPAVRKAEQLPARI